MYMTRVFLRSNPSPSVTHGILSSAFPGVRNSQANEGLWRIDSLGDSRVLIIVSKKTPDLALIADRIGLSKLRPFETTDGAKLDKTLDYEPFIAQIESNQIWNFRLCANPIEHKKKSPDDKRGKIFALRTIEEQIEWVMKQGAKYGFRLKGCSIIGDSWISFNKVRIRSVTYDGVLEVIDADAFRTALTQGIGRGKAYGCGLLTVARIKT